MKKFIAVAGNMGSGKTSMVDFLHTRYGFEPVYEPYTTNPYLDDFYQDMRSWAFHSQLYFLTLTGDPRGLRLSLRRQPDLDLVPAHARYAKPLDCIYEVFTRDAHDLGRGNAGGRRAAGSARSDGGQG